MQIILCPNCLSQAKSLLARRGFMRRICIYDGIRSYLIYRSRGKQRPILSGAIMQLTLHALGLMINAVPARIEVYIYIGFFLIRALENFPSKINDRVISKRGRVLFLAFSYYRLQWQLKYVN